MMLWTAGAVSEWQREKSAKRKNLGFLHCNPKEENDGGNCLFLFASAAGGLPIKEQLEDLS